MRRDEALRILRSYRSELDRFGIESLELFGSVARDEAGPDSDLDLLVDFKGSATYDHYIDLKFFLEDAMGCPIDLVMSKALKPRMRTSVERESVRVA